MKSVKLIFIQVPKLINGLSYEFLFKSAQNRDSYTNTYLLRLIKLKGKTMYTYEIISALFDCKYNILIYFILLLELVLGINCTIDMNIEDFEYIAKQLSKSECRRLVAALYFVSYELPHSVKYAEKMIHHDTTCLTLLLEWNSGKDEWMGAGKSHEIVRRRLMQLDKIWLARWLDHHVYYRLSKDLDNTLMSDQYLEVDMSSKLASKLVQDKADIIEQALSVTGVMLWVICATMIGGVFVLVCFVMYGVYVSRSYAEKARQIQLGSLLKTTFEDVDDGDDDDEDIIEPVTSARSRRKK